MKSPSRFACSKIQTSRTMKFFMKTQVHRSKGPSLYYVSKETGWVGSEKWQFLLTFSTIYADAGWVGGWIRKSPKTCWRNIGMVPYLGSFALYNMWKKSKEAPHGWPVMSKHPNVDWVDWKLYEIWQCNMHNCKKPNFSEKILFINKDIIVTKFTC